MDQVNQVIECAVGLMERNWNDLKRALQDMTDDERDWRHGSSGGDVRKSGDREGMGEGEVGAIHLAMDSFLQAAIEEAERGAREGGIPIGAVLVHAGRIIGRGHNARVQKGSAILHGEMAALEQAGRQKAAVYRDSVLYTTLSPCAMCSGAILLYGIPRIVIGENQTFQGEEALLASRGVTLEVRQDPTCIHLLQSFIREHPVLWNEDIGVV